MAKLYGITKQEDKVAIAAILIKYGYAVRIITESAANTKRKEKVLEYFKDGKIE